MTMRTGVVRRINYRTGRLALELESDDYVVASVADNLEYVDLGDDAIASATTNATSATSVLLM